MLLTHNTVRGIKVGTLRSLLPCNLHIIWNRKYMWCVNILGHVNNPYYEGVSKSFRTESNEIYAYLWYYSLKSNTKGQRVMATKLTRLTHKITIQVHLVAESYTIRSSLSRRPVRKRLDTPSYMEVCGRLQDRK